MNTIKAVLEAWSGKDKDGYFPEIAVYTKGGREFIGSLVHWDPLSAPNLVKLTTKTSAVIFVNLADLEAVARVG